ncbi:Ras guanine nucleotide exchange factor Q [Pelomyxa schiedti]|nr:Ras guanine nucleotide exchange factor Q [Pelomyxa schiedti]
MQRPGALSSLPRSSTQIMQPHQLLRGRAAVALRLSSSPPIVISSQSAASLSTSLPTGSGSGEGDLVRATPVSTGTPPCSLSPSGLASPMHYSAPNIGTTSPLPHSHAGSFRSFSPVMMNSFAQPSWRQRSEGAQFMHLSTTKLTSGLSRQQLCPPEVRIQLQAAMQAAQFEAEALARVRERAFSEPSWPSWEYSMFLMENDASLLSSPEIKTPKPESALFPIVAELKPEDPSSIHSSTVTAYIEHLTQTPFESESVDTLLLTHQYFIPTAELLSMLINMYFSLGDHTAADRQQRTLDIIKHWVENYNSIICAGERVLEFISRELEPQHKEWGNDCLNSFKKNLARTALIQEQKSLLSSPLWKIVESSDFEEAVISLWRSSPLIHTKKKNLKSIKRAFYADEIITYTLTHFPWLTREDIVSLGNLLAERRIIKCRDKALTSNRKSESGPASGLLLDAETTTSTSLPLLQTTTPKKIPPLPSPQRRPSVFFSKEQIHTADNPPCLTRQASVPNMSPQSNTSSSNQFLDRPILYSFLKTHKSDYPKPIAPKAQHIRFTDLHPVELARQLTIIESKLFMAVTPPELTRQVWNHKVVNEQRRLAPNVCRIIDHVNFVSLWVASEIVLTPNFKQRVCIVRRFIQTAQQCRVLNNWSSMYAISLGLSSFAISRLAKTWQAISRSEKQFFDNTIEELVQANMHTYRKHLSSCGLPAIPHLAMWLKDLTFIEDGNSDYTTEEQVNWGKMRLLATIFKQLYYLQSCKYKLKPQMQVQDYIKNATSLPPEKLREMSLLCESSH